MKSSLGFVFSMLFAFGAFAAHHEMSEPPRPSFSTTDTTLVTAIVEAIDYETREVSLRRGDGEVITFTASDEAGNLSKVVVGDTLIAEHSVSFSVEVMPNKDKLEPAAAEMAASVRTDLETNTFKLRFADGVVQEFVARNPSNLERSQIGDLVVMTTTESVGIIVEHTVAPKTSQVKQPAAPQITMGNGADNWIITEGATRDGATFTFPEVKIAGNGWLVMHPFKDGKPNGDIYVGHTFVEDGVSKDVDITVDETPEPGEMFIVMLHRDVNENEKFDFVFISERKVLDEAVFEGAQMIGHAYPTP